MVQKRAFTLIEVLVVTAIIGVLAAILFPTLSRAKERSRQATCASNMKQVGVAISIYSTDWDEQYPGVGAEIDTSAPVPAPTFLASAESEKAASEYGAEPQSAISPTSPQPLEGMWTGPKWHDALSGYIGSTDVYRCPADPSDSFVTDAMGHPAVDDRGRPIDVPSFLLNGWLVNTVDGEKRTISTVRRPSQTIELAEGDRDYICTISSCVDDDFHPWEPFANWAPTVAAHRHGTRANYLFADNHVRSLEFSQTISPVTAAGSWPARAVALDLYNLE